MKSLVRKQLYNYDKMMKTKFQPQLLLAWVHRRLKILALCDLLVQNEAGTVKGNVSVDLSSEAKDVKKLVWLSLESRWKQMKKKTA